MFAREYDTDNGIIVPQATGSPLTPKTIEFIMREAVVTLGIILPPLLLYGSDLPTYSCLQRSLGLTVKSTGNS